MKKIIITTMAITFVLTFTIVSAHAGSSKHLRKHLKGALIASNPLILGAAIADKLHNDLPKVHVSKPNHQERSHKKEYKRHGRKHHHKKGYRRHGRRHNQHRYSSNRYGYRDYDGHWEIKRRWVPEEYEERWVRGHYNKKGRWVAGRYRRYVVQEGYWKEKRIWVSHY